jgi:hypothetical protein
MLSILEKISATHGVFAVAGNHDGWRGQVPRIKRQFEKAGFSFLVNQNSQLTIRGERLAIAGTDFVWKGRPSKTTTYQRQVKTRFDVSWQLDGKQLEIAAAADGVFPLITNLLDWKPEEVLQAYKRQPTIEKRFSQLKTDFRVAPVYLKNVQRIVGLLAVYFFALMVQSLLERELRQAMEANGTESLPLYPEGRPCRRPTTRQVLDTFESIARHSLCMSGNDEFEIFTTELAPIHRSILKLLGVPLSHYRNG